MIRAKKPEDLRVLTPILAAAGPVLVSVIIGLLGYMFSRTLSQIDDSIKKQGEKLDVVIDRLHEKEVVIENRLGRVESEVKFIDIRVDRLERSKQLALK